MLSYICMLQHFGHQVLQGAAEHGGGGGGLWMEHGHQVLLSAAERGGGGLWMEQIIHA